MSPHDEGRIKLYVVTILTNESGMPTRERVLYVATSEDELVERCLRWAWRSSPQAEQAHRSEEPPTRRGRGLDRRDGSHVDLFWRSIAVSRPVADFLRQSELLDRRFVVPRHDA